MVKNNTSGGEVMYICDFRLEYCGWCIFWQSEVGALTIEYVSGAFESKEHAKSEGHRLNKLKPVGVK